MQMMKMAVSLAMILMPTLSFAEWKIEAQGAKVMSLPADRLGAIAKLPAKAPSYGVTAYLQIECFKSPELTQRHFALVVTKIFHPVSRTASNLTTIPQSSAVPTSEPVTGRCKAWMTTRSHACLQQGGCN
jgi:hypothetical protein